jgi:hypothetical protein
MPIASAAVSIGGALIGAKGSKDAAKTAAQATATNPYSGTSSYGTTAFNTGTRTFDINQAANPFAQLATVGGLGSLANAYTAPGSAYYGAPPELIAALQGTNDTSGAMAARLAQLRSMASPENNAAAVSLKDKLFSLGQLGSTSGAAGQEAMLRAQNQQDLGFQQTAQDYANAQAQQRFQNALTAVNAGSTLAGNQFQQGVSSQGILANQFQQLLQQAGLGVSAGGGQAPAAAMAAAAAPSTTQTLLGAGLPYIQQALAPRALPSNPSAGTPIPESAGGNYSYAIPGG